MKQVVGTNGHSSPLVINSARIAAIDFFTRGDGFDGIRFIFERSEA